MYNILRDALMVYGHGSHVIPTMFNYDMDKYQKEALDRFIINTSYTRRDIKNLTLSSIACIADVSPDSLADEFHRIPWYASAQSAASGLSRLENIRGRVHRRVPARDVTHVQQGIDASIKLTRTYIDMEENKKVYREFSAYEIVENYWQAGMMERNGSILRNLLLQLEKNAKRLV